MKDKTGSLGSWATLAGAVTIGAVLALVVGILIGNGTEKTKTVTLGQSEVLLPTSEADRSKSPAAPAFTKETLAALPTTNWITNGGSLNNNRYSPLTQIDTSNVADLKGVWHTKLQTGSMAAKYSAESQPIVYNGVMYVSTGANEVFAVDVKSGDVKWKYDPGLDQAISTVCCGWLSRGVAIGDGRVYSAQLDGKLTALDMATGRVVWSKSVADWKKGYTLTAAPLYYEGRVFIGTAGGEFGIRGHLMAFDAKTGGEVWRFYTIPDPKSNDVGHDTWPKDNDSWQKGGAPIWQTPAVDPELGMIYFSTGNASPDLNGELRAGDNLFAASMVALDVNTGKYKWHFQQVHHDIWDYDAPSPMVLYDAVVDGKVRKGVAQPSKTGWLYMLDRETGKPIFPITEKPVPQDPNQKTAKTQPYPSNPPFAMQEVDDDIMAKLQKAADSQVGQGKKVEIEKGKIFDPFNETMVAVAPGPAGGTNWPPSSYNQKLQMFYVCSQDTAAGLQKTEVESKYHPGQIYLGSILVSTGFNGKGHVTAIDAQTGKIVWNVEWPDSCYSGTVTTAGNLVFVGRNNGELQAYDARNGSRLWSFQTGSGANNTVTTFMQDDKQYVAFYAGGNSLAGTARGNDLWLFALDGTLGPVKAGSGAGAIAHAGDEGEAEQSEQTPENTESAPADGGGDEQANANVKGDAAAGKQVFADNCSTCHGAEGKGGNGGPDLTTVASAKDLAAVTKQVADGGGGMPAFKGTLSAKQVADVSAFVVDTLNG